MLASGKDTSALAEWMRARPAFGVVALYIGGICLHRYLPDVPAAWLIAAGLCAIAAIIARHREWLAGPALCAALILVGIAAAQLQAFSFPANHIGLDATAEPRLAELELRFDQPLRVTPANPARHRPGRQSGSASVVAIRRADGWQPVTGEITCSFSWADPPILAGQRVQAIGWVQRPAPADNPGEFDWSRYFRTQRVLATFRATHAFDVSVAEPGAGASSLGASRTKLRDLLSRGFSASDDSDRALLQALLFGDRDAAVRPAERDFQKTGTSHLIASSGVRLGVLGAMVYLLCRLARLDPRVAGVAVAVAALGWGLATLPTPQALRPAIVAGAIGIGVAFRRSADPIQLLACAAGLLLLIQPLDVYNAGFQFSFVIVLGMLLFVRPLTRYLQQIVDDPNDKILAHYGRLKGWPHWRRQAKLAGATTLSATAVAWIVSIPLVAWHFEQLTPWAVPISIVLSPMVFASLGAGFLKITATAVAPGYANAWAHTAALPASLFRHAIRLCAHLPGADIPASQPGPWIILLFYALLLAPLIPAIAARRRWRWSSLACCGVVAILPVLLAPSSARQAGAARLTLLSVGAGQCAILELDGRQPILLDDGSSTVTDVLHQTLEPFLHHEGATRIDSIYLSHGDYDHISATAGAWAECDVQHIITSPFFRKHAHESAPCQELVALLDASGHPPELISAPQSIDLGAGASFKVLWPPKSCDMNSNNAGMVLRLECAGRSILFPADVQDPAMRELLKNPAQLKSDILVAAHHGSSESLTKSFVAAVDPKLILSSNASRLTKKQRVFETLIGARPLIRTGASGAIEVDISRTGVISVVPFRGSSRTMRVDPVESLPVAGRAGK